MAVRSAASTAASAASWVSVSACITCQYPAPTVSDPKTRAATRPSRPTRRPSGRSRRTTRRVRAPPGAAGSRWLIRDRPPAQPQPASDRRAGRGGAGGAGPRSLNASSRPTSEAVREQARAAVRDERQGDPGQWDQLQIAGRDDRGLAADHERQPGAEERPEVVRRGGRDAEAAHHDHEVAAEHGQHAREPELLADRRQGEVGVDGGDRQVACHLREPGPEAGAEDARRGRTHAAPGSPGSPRPGGPATGRARCRRVRGRGRTPGRGRGTRPRRARCRGTRRSGSRSPRSTGRGRRRRRGGRPRGPSRPRRSPGPAPASRPRAGDTGAAAA